MGEEGVIGYVFLLSGGHRRKSSEILKVRVMESEGGNVEEESASK